MTEYKSFRKVLNVLKSPSGGPQIDDKTMFFEFFAINSFDRLYIFVLMSKFLWYLKFSDSCMFMLMPLPPLTPATFMMRRNPYVDELCIVAVRKASIHCFYYWNNFQLNIELPRKTACLRRKVQISFCQGHSNHLKECP